MADQGIAFGAPMIEALLAGRKTQTRRLAKKQPGHEFHVSHLYSKPAGIHQVAFKATGDRVVSFPVRYSLGDRLWVREAYFQWGYWDATGGLTRTGRVQWSFVGDARRIQHEAPADYREGHASADQNTPAWHKRLGRFMPRAASRLTLVVTDVQVQRLQEITEDDARAEGALLPWTGFDPASDTRTGRSEFEAVWNIIHGPDAWDANPWVVAITFNLRHGNIDSMQALRHHGALA